ncbi:hypothetical protein GE09DRAFT_1143884 [Coniochaeta sp. 2T2.1]|nr:hypothetical protein GE09DRAFT_1143884 [Coniochaeta sp. 2T2.1]
MLQSSILRAAAERSGAFPSFRRLVLGPLGDTRPPGRTYRFSTDVLLGRATTPTINGLIRNLELALLTYFHPRFPTVPDPVWEAEAPSGFIFPQDMMLMPLSTLDHWMLFRSFKGPWTLAMLKLRYYYRENKEEVKLTERWTAGEKWQWLREIREFLNEVAWNKDIGGSAAWSSADLPGPWYYW